jgi:large subunit ribosomal protein L16
MTAMYVVVGKLDSYLPDKPVQKPAETRMGKGKGRLNFGVVRPGVILYEMDGVDESVAREAMRLASHKLPIATRFLAKI